MTALALAFGALLGSLATRALMRASRSIDDAIAGLDR
jgi:hypothetical protein